MLNKKLLLAYDGSPYSQEALTEALEIAKNCKAGAVVVAAVDVTEEFECEAPGLTEKMEVRAGAMLAEVARRFAEEGIAAKTEVHIGEPHEVIVETAQRHGVDLIVMGSHGVTGLRRILMGSVTSRVIGHAPCKVLVVPHRAH